MTCLVTGTAHMADLSADQRHLGVIRNATDGRALRQRRYTPKDGDRERLAGILDRPLNGYSETACALAAA